jgi:D-inositol-3-phosphate glycosyltransferase
MHIAMVSEHASPLAAPGGTDSGGQNVHVAELGTALAAAGHEVTVWTRRDTPELPDVVPFARGVQVRHVDAGPPLPIPKDEIVDHVPQLAAGLEAAWRADPPDVVHSHFWMSGMAALTAARWLDLPVVQTFHALGHVKRRHQGDEDTSPQGRVGAERAIARGVDRVVATCTDEVFELTRLGVHRQRMTVVPCGVDTARFTADGPALPGRTGRQRLVTVGRLVRRKGVDETIRALRRLPEAELLVAGGPRSEELDGGLDVSLDDSPDIARLRGVAEEAGVADRVRLLGSVPRDEVPALLRSADAVVCVPWYEPFGMVPLEAMACGRPVVASAVGGLVDTVVDGVTGVHVPPRRADALEAALTGMLGRETVRTAYGIAGRDRAVSRYGWDRVAEATARVYQQVLAERESLGERRVAAGAER